jgi:sugar phosphate isomerase/epimerase
MDTWYWQTPAPIEEQISTIKNLGFQGFALTSDQRPHEFTLEMVTQQLGSPGMYTPVTVGSYPEGAVETLAAVGGWIWLAVSHPGYQNSDEAGDAEALELIHRVADECVEAGLPGVALYPHVGIWKERVSDAIRLAQKANRPEVRIVFNQYHFMRENNPNLIETLSAAAPYLQAVTLNGSDEPATIVPLGEGNYDPSPILEQLVLQEFKGHVGLQGYSIAGDIPAKLAAAKQEWDRLMVQLREFERSQKR